MFYLARVVSPVLMKAIALVRIFCPEALCEKKPVLEQEIDQA